jgi:hypothetical protein
MVDCKTTRLTLDCARGRGRELPMLVRWALLIEDLLREASNCWGVCALMFGDLTLYMSSMTDVVANIQNGKSRSMPSRADENRAEFLCWRGEPSNCRPPTEAIQIQERRIRWGGD